MPFGLLACTSTIYIIQQNFSKQPYTRLKGTFSPQIVAKGKKGT